MHIDDLKNAIKLLHGDYAEDGSFHKYNSIYPFTNENLDGYMKGLEGQKVLTVVGSGDHYLNAIYNGAEVVDCFDINRLTIYYLKLKKAAIECLDIEEFKYFFSGDTSFNYNIYKKFNENLDDDTLLFWDYLYKEVSNQGAYIMETSLFYDLPYERIGIYKDEKKYNELKEKLKKIEKIKFIATDINLLSKYLQFKKYDTIFLSNIADYQKIYDFYDKVKEMDQFLNNYGKIYFAYIFSYENRKINGPILNILKNDRHCTSIIMNDEFQTKDKVAIYNKIKER